MSQPAPQQIELPPENVTILGAFNPSILRSPWASEYALDKGDEVDFFLGEENGPILNRVRRDGDTFYWLCSRERLVAYGPPQYTGGFVSRVLQALPHTPVRAAGVNLRLDVPGKLPGALGPWSLTIDRERAAALLGGESLGVGWTHVCRRADGVQLTLRASSSMERNVVLDFNYHLDATGPEARVQTGSLAKHVTRAEEFHADARRLLRSLDMERPHA
jgi:hypothetical protein